jgi:hypothetical protein
VEPRRSNGKKVYDIEYDKPDNGFTNDKKYGDVF